MQHYLQMAIKVILHQRRITLTNGTPQEEHNGQDYVAVLQHLVDSGVSCSVLVGLLRLNLQ